MLLVVVVIPVALVIVVVIPVAMVIVVILFHVYHIILPSLSIPIRRELLHPIDRLPLRQAVRPQSAAVLRSGGFRHP